VLAEAAASCFGYTARLALLRDGDHAAVRGVRWRLEVTGPPDLPAAGVAASLDAFTIRGDQANRSDLASVRWSEAAQNLTAEGLVRVPEIAGDLREGDQAHILAYIQTPGGDFGVRGLIFGLRRQPGGPVALTPTVLPPAECPPT
jgi:hypothetical protein